MIDTNTQGNGDMSLGTERTLSSAISSIVNIFHPLLGYKWNVTLHNLSITVLPLHNILPIVVSVSQNEISAEAAIKGQIFGQKTTFIPNFCTLPRRLRIV